MKQLFLFALLPLTLWTTSEIAAAAPPKPAPAPAGAAVKSGWAAFELETLDQAKLSFSSQRKRVTVVAFWASWCKPCLMELAWLEGVRQELETAPDLAVLAVAVEAIEDEEAGDLLGSIAGEQGFDGTVLVDPEGRLLQHTVSLKKPMDAKAALGYLPLCVVIDEAGTTYHLWGLDEEAGAQTWAAGLRRLIDQARRRALPASPPLPDEVESGPRPEVVNLPFPKRLSKTEIEERVPIYRDYLKEKYSRLSAKQLETLMVEFRRQLESGATDVRLTIPQPDAE